MSDFDFAIGSWNVANRHLRRAFTGCTEWFPTHGTHATATA